MIPKFEKKFLLVCRACRRLKMNQLIYNTLQFDQYSRLTILLKKFRFSVKYLKKNLIKAYSKYDSEI